MSVAEFEELQKAFDKAIDLSGADRDRVVRELREQDPRLAEQLGRMLQHDASFESDDSLDETIGFGPADESPRFVEGFEILEEIGRGGMGVVYRARQNNLDRVVALKMIRVGRFASEMDVQRFAAEVDAVAKLDHPNIVSIYEIGSHHGEHYFTMQLVEGSRFDTYLESDRFRRADALEILSQVCEAVAYCHGHGIAHRDLKPSNIFLKGDVARVGDYGLLAKHLVQPDYTLAAMTQTGAALGTPSYMPPEQASGGHVITTAADIYSLGAIMYELLTGQPPHKGATAFETVMSVRNNTPPTPRKLNPQVDSELELICLKCIDRNPDDRYSSAAALASDLENWLAGDAISVKHPSFRAATAQWVKQNRKFAYSVFAMLLGVVLIVPSATIIFGDNSSIGKVYEHFPDAEPPWFMAIEALPHWTPEVSLVCLVLLIWPSLGLWNAIVTRPKSIRHAASLGGLTSLVCAGIIVATMGWLAVVLMTADYSSKRIRVLGEAIWMKEGATPEKTRSKANQLFKGLDDVPEEIRAKVLADRIFSDQVAYGPRALVLIGFMSWMIALPIFYGTVIAYVLKNRKLRFWLLLPRYALAWLSVTVFIVLASAYAFGAIIGRMQTDKFKYHVVMIAVAGGVFWLAMRRWRRVTVSPDSSQLESQPVTPDPV